MANTIEQAHILITDYQRMYQIKFGEKPIMNRNKIKYLISDALKDLSVSQFRELMEYYVRTESDPSLVTLCYDYADILNTKRQNEKDLNQRRQLMRETEVRTKEFRERFGK